MVEGFFDLENVKDEKNWLADGEVSKAKQSHLSGIVMA